MRSKSTKRPTGPSVAMAMLQSLRSVDGLARSLDSMAPEATSAAGGGDSLVARYGRPTGAGFWSIRSAPEELWAAMASEHQAEHRGAVAGSSGGPSRQID